MKFLKKIFGLNGRLDRKGYLLLGVLPMVGWIFLVNTLATSQINKIILLSLFVPILILIVVSSVKRGRDSGLNGLVTLFLFVAVPMVVIVLIAKIEIDIIYAMSLFIIYLLLVPSSLKELKIIGKVEYIFIINSMSLIFFVLISFVFFILGTI